MLDRLLALKLKISPGRRVVRHIYSCEQTRRVDPLSISTSYRKGGKIQILYCSVAHYKYLLGMSKIKHGADLLRSVDFT